MFRENEDYILFDIDDELEAVFFFKKKEPDFPVVLPIQRHTANIIVLENFEPPKGTSDGYDGIIARRQNDIALGVKTADCLPVLFASGKVKGVLHAGWRGIIRGIFEELHAKLQTLDEKTEELKVVIGPHICAKCYEIKEDVEIAFSEFCQQKSIDEKMVILKRDGKTFLDLLSCTREMLKKIGVKHIFESSICVREDTRFFSKRRGDLSSQISCIRTKKGKREAQ